MNVKDLATSAGKVRDFSDLSPCRPLLEVVQANHNQTMVGPGPQENAGCVGLM